MDPNNHEMPGFQLPQPVESTLPVPETAPPVAERLAAPAMPPAAAMPAPSIPLPVPPVAAQPQAVPTSAVSSGTPAIADDADLIEKEWVQRAKQIVEQTRQDPYIQNRELNAFKADYLQKRYNKTIKLGE